MLTPADLRRLANPLLRARFTAHLLDENGPNRSAFEEIFRTAVEELLAAGFGLPEIAVGTFMEEGELRRRMFSAVETSAHYAYATGTTASAPASSFEEDDDGPVVFTGAITAWRTQEAALRRRLAELDGAADRLTSEQRHELLALDRAEDDAWLQVAELAGRLGLRPPVRHRPRLPF
jgi:hypothetical protein